MPLVEGVIKDQLKAFILNANQSTVTDMDKSVDDFCGQLENVIYEAIKSITITIPPGEIITAGSPSTQANANPVIIEGTIT